jgi:hypothetical protein
MNILIITAVICCEIAFVKFVWLNYGVFFALLFLGIGLGVVSFAMTFIFTMVSAVFEYNVESVQYKSERWARIGGAALQFVKSFVFVNLSCIAINFSLLAYTFGLDPEGAAFVVVNTLELPAAIYYAYSRARTLHQRMSLPPAKTPNVEKVAA